MTWGGFSAKGTLPLAFPEGRIDSEGYQGTLQSHLLPNAGRIGGRGWIFQQDNAPMHTSNSTRQWLSDEGVRTMDWPARSPDLNPIENLWGIVARRVYQNGRHYNSKTELRAAIEREWNLVSPETLRNLTDSMVNRMFEVITNKGGYTSY